MNGIKMNDCKFYVDKEKRTIVCVIPSVIVNYGKKSYTKNMVFDFIDDNFHFSDLNLYDAIDTWGNTKIKKQLTMPNSFIGKAVCAPGDEWDEDLGKMIAFAKAKDKCYKSFFKRANLFVQVLDKRLGDAINTFNSFGQALEDKREGMKQRINEKLGLTE